MNKINDKDYKVLTPFKGWVLENFPFIEADFDAITNYELYCKIVEYLNNVIYNQNQVEDLASELVAGYNDVVDYVNDYFDNLDVQDEINIKLDAMAEDGSLTGLIETYMNPFLQEQNSRINNIQNQVTSIASGSPAGVYATVSALQTADPDHSKIYVVTATGNWYYYDTANSQWASGGTYQESVIGSKAINFNQLNEELQNTFTESYLNKQIQTPLLLGFAKVDGTVEEHNAFYHYKISVNEGDKFYYQTKTRGTACVYVVVDSNDTPLISRTSGASTVTAYTGFVEIPKNGAYLYINNDSNTKNESMVFKRNNIEIDKNKPLKDNYVLGYVTGTGTITKEASQLTTKSIVNLIPLKLKKGDVIRTSYGFTVAKYDSSLNFVSRTGLTNYQYVIDSDGLYRITLFNFNNAALTGSYNTDSIISDNLANDLEINKQVEYAKYLHISFDDVHSCLEDITTNANTYNSIFDNSFLSDLKDLHNKYGAVFTLNTFNTFETSTYDIANTTTKFKYEFDKNSDWLKFSFHAENNTSNYSTNDDAILTSYNKFVSSVLTFGTYNCLDNFIRLGFFTGNSYNIDKLLSDSCNLKPHGLFTSDDTRNSYYLNDTQKTYIKNNVFAYDTSKNIYLINTKTRLENLTSASDLNLTNYDHSYICEIFTHEYEWDSDLKTLLENALKQAIQLNYQFVYFNTILQLHNNL